MLSFIFGVTEWPLIGCRRFFYTLSGWSKLQCAKFSANQQREAGSPTNVFPSVVTLFGFALRYDWLVWLSGHALIGQDRLLAGVLTPLDRRSSALTFLLCNESWTTKKTTLKLFQEMPKYLSKRSTTRESEQILSRWWFCREESYRLLSQEKKNFYLIVGQVKLEDCVHCWSSWGVIRVKKSETTWPNISLFHESQLFDSCIVVTDWYCKTICKRRK